MVGTDYADEGIHIWCGEYPFTEFEDETEVVPFEEVWVRKKSRNSMIRKHTHQRNG
jgi:hypothetical protein